MINIQRKKELRKEFPNGDAVGKAFINFYIEQRRSYKEPNFKTTLTQEEMKFLRNTVKIAPDKELFKPYQLLRQVLRQFIHWLDYYEHIYYHGLFRGLAIVQTPDYDVQIYNLQKNQANIDEQTIENAKMRYTQSIAQITDILMSNWNDIIAFALKNLYIYSLRLEKIQELTSLDFAPILPDMKHHENEVKELQRIARVFKNNLNKYISDNSFEVDNNILQTLNEFVQIDINTLKPNEEEKADNIQKAIDTVNMTKGIINTD